MRFMFKKHRLKRGKHGLVYHGNRLQERGKKEVEWKEGKFSGKKGREALMQSLQEIRA
jgi:hypothetical protein